MSTQVVVTKIDREPSELRDGADLPQDVRDVYEALPPPSRYPTFLVEFHRNNKEYKIKMSLELEGRDAEWDTPEDIGYDDMPDVAADIMDAVYASKPYKDAEAALDQAPQSFWQ